MQIPNRTSSEPAVNVGVAGTGIVGALVVILHFVFPKIPDEVVTSIIVIIAVISPVILGIITRSKVWSPKSVQKISDNYEKEIRDLKTFKNPRNDDTDPPPAFKHI